MANATASNTAQSLSLPADLEKLRIMLVNNLKNTIDKALAPLAESVTKLCETTEDHSRRITDLEEALWSYSDRTVDLEEMCALLKNSNKLLADTVDDLENRSRHCNLRVINLVEKVEGTDTVEFMSGFFAEVLGSDLFPTPPNSKPRPMIVKFHYYGDKKLRVSWDTLNNHAERVIFFPDYSATVNKKQPTFNPVKSLLYRKGVKFRMIFPAVLKVDYDGKTHSFDTANEAQDFYGRHFGDGWILSNSTHKLT